SSTLPPTRYTLFPYTTLFRSWRPVFRGGVPEQPGIGASLSGQSVGLGRGRKRRNLGRNNLDRRPPCRWNTISYQSHTNGGKGMKKVLIVALLGFVAAVSLRADIIPSFAGTSPGTGTNTVWNYTINITTDEQVSIGDFFTIYDFGPFITGSNMQPTGWTFSSSLTT